MQTIYRYGGATLHEGVGYVEARTAPAVVSGSKWR